MLQDHLKDIQNLVDSLKWHQYFQAQCCSFEREFSTPTSTWNDAIIVSFKQRSIVTSWGCRQMFCDSLKHLISSWEDEHKFEHVYSRFYLPCLKFCSSIRFKSTLPSRLSQDWWRWDKFMDVYIAVNESFEDPPNFSLDCAGSLSLHSAHMYEL